VLSVTLAVVLAAVTVDVKGSVRAGDVDVAFVEHSHKTAANGRNVGMFTLEMSRSGSEKKTRVSLQSRYDDLFAEVDVAGTLVALRKVSYGTFDVRAVGPTPTTVLSEDECREQLGVESARRGLTAQSGFTTSHGVVTMSSDAFRGHCGMYTRELSFFSGSYVRDVDVETHVFAGTSTYVGDVLVTFHGANPKHDDDVLVFELSLSRDAAVTPLLFTSKPGREHRMELAAHGAALGVRAAKADEVHVRLLAPREPLTQEACEALVREEVKKTGRKDGAPISTVNADGLVTVKSTTFTARCGRYSGRVTFSPK
jgi:hypothetical protein